MLTPLLFTCMMSFPNKRWGSFIFESIIHWGKTFSTGQGKSTLHRRASIMMAKRGEVQSLESTIFIINIKLLNPNFINYYTMQTCLYPFFYISWYSAGRPNHFFFFFFFLRNTTLYLSGRLYVYKNVLLRK